jgi:hypothetical protein
MRKGAGLMKSLDLVLDNEIKDISEDKFGHKDYSDALVEMIDILQGSYSIGLLGPWGVGKSTVKELYCSTLSQSKDKEKIKIVTFNAWKYGGDDLKRALVLEVVKALNGLKSDAYEKVIEKLDLEVEEKKNENRTLKDFTFDWVSLAKACFFVVIPYLGITYALGLILNTFAILSGIIAPIMAALMVAFINTLFNNSLLIQLFRERKVVEHPVTQSSKFEDVLKKALSKYLGGKGKKYEKIVIFVDDLDRLSPSEMVNGIDAIRVFMEMDFTNFNGNDKFKGFVFVVSCDEDKVAKALVPRTKIIDSDSDLPGSLSNIQDAKDFLDRIFQFRLEIPAVPKGDLRQYASSILESKEEVAVAVKTSEQSISNIINRLIHSDVENPRNAKQLMNAFLQSFWLANRRENRNNHECGSIVQGYISNNLEALAVFCALRINYNSFYQLLLDEPKFIHTFMRSFVLNNSLDIADDSLHLLSEVEVELMKRITKPRASSDEIVELHYQLKKEYYPVRSYLSANQDIKFPENIRPYLFLNQEPIEKEIGDYSNLLNALKNADLFSAIASLKESPEVRPLSENNVNILSSLIESNFISNATEREKANASKVIAFMLERLDGSSDHRKLTSFVANTYATNETAREIMDLEKMLSNLEAYSISELTSILEQLSANYLSETPSFGRLYAIPDQEEFSKHFNFILDSLFQISEKIDSPSLNEVFKKSIYEFLAGFVSNPSFENVYLNGNKFLGQCIALWGEEVQFEMVPLIGNRIDNERFGMGSYISNYIEKITAKDVPALSEHTHLVNLTGFVYSQNIASLMPSFLKYFSKHFQEYPNKEIVQIEETSMQWIDELYNEKGIIYSKDHETYLQTIRLLVQEELIETDGVVSLITEHAPNVGYINNSLCKIIELLIPEHTKEFETLLSSWINFISSLTKGNTRSLRKMIFSNFKYLNANHKSNIRALMQSTYRNFSSMNNNEYRDIVDDWFEYVPDDTIDDDYAKQIFDGFAGSLNFNNFDNHGTNPQLVSDAIEYISEKIAGKSILLTKPTIQDYIVNATQILLNYHNKTALVTLFDCMKNKWTLPSNHAASYTPTRILTDANNFVNGHLSMEFQLKVIHSALTVPVDDASTGIRQTILAKLLSLANHYFEEVNSILGEIEDNKEIVIPELSGDTLANRINELNFEAFSKEPEKLNILRSIIRYVTYVLEEDNELLFLQTSSNVLPIPYFDYILRNARLYGTTLLNMLEHSKDFDLKESTMVALLNEIHECLTEEDPILEFENFLPVALVTIAYAGSNKYTDYLNLLVEQLRDMNFKMDDLSNDARENALNNLSETNNALTITYLLFFIELTGIDLYKKLSNYHTLIGNLQDESARMFREKFGDK